MHPHEPFENQTHWHSRGYLPHYEGGTISQFITYRLGDSLPQPVLNRIEAELRDIPEQDRLLARYRRCEEYLDRGIGKCWLARPDIAAIVEENFMFFDAERYQLHAWCIMPNHVHVLITPVNSWQLEKILHSWKSYSAKQANKLLSHTGQFWQEEYFDRYIRTQEHFAYVVDYIDNNPAKAGLPCTATAWYFRRANR